MRWRHKTLRNGKVLLGAEVHDLDAEGYLVASPSAAATDAMRAHPNYEEPVPPARSVNEPATSRRGGR